MRAIPAARSLAPLIPPNRLRRIGTACAQAAGRRDTPCPSRYRCPALGAVGGHLQHGRIRFALQQSPAGDDAVAELHQQLVAGGQARFAGSIEAAQHGAGVQVGVVG